MTGPQVELVGPMGAGKSDADTRAPLAGQRVVYLPMDVEEAIKRTGLNAARPLLAVNPRKQWHELVEARRSLYEEVATVVIGWDACLRPTLLVRGEVRDREYGCLVDSRSLSSSMACGPCSPATRF